MSKTKLGLILRGIGMGIAEVIPGVSGGTIAFITGIYFDLLNSIKAFDLQLLKLLAKGEFKQISERIMFPFLIFIMLGMVTGLLSGIFLVSHMLESLPEVLWAIFFALILASVPFLIKTMNEFKLKHFVLLLIAILLAYIITSLSPISAPSNPLYIFFGGMIAIVALVLPGISGSFILLLLGLYTLIIPTLKNFLSSPSIPDLEILAFFSLGCITGLVLFSRLISAAFDKHHDSTIAIMSGFMIGSLNKIWPWRNPSEILIKDNNEIIDLSKSDLKIHEFAHDSFKVISETNVLPDSYFANPNVLLVGIAFVISFISVFLLSKSTKHL